MAGEPYPLFCATDSLNHHNDSRQLRKDSGKRTKNKMIRLSFLQGNEMASVYIAYSIMVPVLPSRAARAFSRLVITALRPVPVFRKSMDA